MPADAPTLVTDETHIAPVKILLVDDDPRNLDVLEALLQSHDHRLIRATTGDEALMLLLNHVFAVIVLDIRMPGMSGIELAGLIKQRRRTQHVPIIFLTAYYQEDRYVLEGYGSGAVDYLTKPVNPEILRSKIAVFVDLFRKTQALASANAALEAEIGQREKAEERLRLLNDELEARVAARTAELVRLNAELQQRERALQASEAQLRFVTDSAPVFIAQLDPDHRFKFANRKLADHFQPGSSDIIGRPFADLFGETTYGRFRAHFNAALAGERVEFETEFAHGGNGVRWLFAVLEPERTPEGEIVGLLAVATDITERKIVEQEVAAARDKALTAARAKDEFLARLSHELRTPLNPVLLLASEAAADAALPAQVRATFETIAQNVTIEARLIDDLLDLTAISRGKLTLAMKQVPMHAVLQDAIAMLSPDIAQKRLKVELRLAAAEDIVFGDDVRLKQICWNVIKNAVKFTPPEGRILVCSQVRPDDPRLVVTVTDTGIGLTPEESGRIFAAFAQGDHAINGSGRFGGLGLGLAISRMLVQLHSGAITAQSEGRGRGATFAIELPLSRTPATASRPADGSSPESPVDGGRAVPVRPMRVLLVEDHPPTCKTLAELLARRRYRVVVATTMIEAQKAAERDAFDFVISDIGLPDGNGCDLMAELRARYDLRGIALTGYGMDEDLVRSHAAGFVAHLTKPVSVRALDEALALMTASSTSSGCAGDALSRVDL